MKTLMGENRLFKHMRKARDTIIQEFLATIRAVYISQVPRWILWFLLLSWKQKTLVTTIQLYWGLNKFLQTHLRIFLTMFGKVISSIRLSSTQSTLLKGLYNKPLALDQKQKQTKKKPCFFFKVTTLQNFLCIPLVIYSYKSKSSFSVSEII